MAYIRFSTDLKNKIIDNGIVANLEDTGAAELKIYDGTQGTSADLGTSGNLIVTISGISWNSATAGLAGVTGTFAGTAVASGTARWGRIEHAGTDGTYRLDGDVGTASTHVFVIDRAVVASGDLISLNDFTFRLNDSDM